MLKFRNHNIILPKYLEIVKKKGSSLIFSASGGRNKEKKDKAAEKIAVGSEGAAEGGCGGNSAAPEPKRSPAALLGKSRTPKKSFVFLLGEKMGRAQIRKCEQNFSLVERALASGGGAERVSFVQSRFALCRITPPISNFPIFARPIRPRKARKGMDSLARRARRGSPSAGSKSLAILSICFAQ